MREIPLSYRPKPANLVKIKKSAEFVRGRDSPPGVFDPWVRWDLGLDRSRSFRVVVVIVVVVTALLLVEQEIRESYI